MPTLPLPGAVRELLAQPNPSVIATLRPDGHPVTVATWYLLDGDRILVNMDAGRKRLEHVRADPRVSLTVLSAQDWYTHVSLIGRVVEIAEDTDLSGIDRLSTQYGGRPYPDREHQRFNAWIEIDRWHGWSGGRPLEVD